MLYLALYLFIPVTRTRLETPMVARYGSHAAYNNTATGVDALESIYKPQIITHKIVSVIRPVARVGVVEPQMYDHHIARKGDSVGKLLLLHIGTVPPRQKRRPRLTEITYIVTLAQKLRQPGRITIMLSVLDPHAISDAVTDTCHLDGLDGRHPRRRQDHTKREPHSQQSICHLFITFTFAMAFLILPCPMHGACPSAGKNTANSPGCKVKKVCGASSKKAISSFASYGRL